MKKIFATFVAVMFVLSTMAFADESTDVVPAPKRNADKLVENALAPALAHHNAMEKSRTAKRAKSEEKTKARQNADKLVENALAPALAHHNAMEKSRTAKRAKSEEKTKQDKMQMNPPMLFQPRQTN